MDININALIEYTEWERSNWQRWFQQQGENALETSTGPQKDGKTNTVRDLIRHIFLVEKFYALWLKGQPLPDPASISTGTIATLFAFGRQARQDLKGWLETLPADQYDVPKELTFAKYHVTATPKKMAIHLMLHETRHWGQVATLLRIAGFSDKTLHDLIASPVMGGAWKVDE